MKIARPDIFKYHNYQSFLTDWFAYKKASQSRFSLRSLAKQAGLASGHLPMVLSGKRPMSQTTLTKLTPFLGLTTREQSFLENLLVLGTSDSHEVRVGALDRMQRFSAFQKQSHRESEVYQYLTHWHYVAIREMAALPGFQADPDWIQKRLKGNMPLADVREALEFLLANGYLTKNSDGSVTPPHKTLDCSGGIFRVALAGFHREIFKMAVQAIEETPSAERNIQGHTCVLSAENLDKAKEIAEEAIRKIRELGADEKRGDSVYHLEVALFPLTQPKPGSAK